MKVNSHFSVNNHTTDEDFIISVLASILYESHWLDQTVITIDLEIVIYQSSYK